MMSDGVDALRVAGLLLRWTRVFDARWRELAGAEALTLQEGGVLGQIDRGVEAPSQIARGLRLDPARVTHLVDRLVSLGYLERQGDPLDRRRNCLRLTASGRERLEEGRRHAATAMTELLDGLSDDERAGLLHGLEGMLRVLV